MPVAVVTDSSGYLPPELLDRYGISVVQLYVVFPDRTVKEQEITDYPGFFEELRRADKLPKTSQPSVGDFIEVFEPLLARGDEVVSIHISGGISGTVEAGRQAAEQLERDGKGGERVQIVDSSTAAGGLAIVTLAGRAAPSSAAPPTRSSTPPTGRAPS
jgi:DegV family protein with EDD domain